MERSTKRLSIDCSKDGRTQQHFKEQCNINFIVEKARKTGLLAHLNNRTPQYADVTKIPDYQDAMETIITANNAFWSLDARSRERFGNDPARMIDFLQDENNYDEAVKLGLVEKKLPVPEVIQKVRIVPDEIKDDVKKPEAKKE